MLSRKLQDGDQVEGECQKGKNLRAEVLCGVDHCRLLLLIVQNLVNLQDLQFSDQGLAKGEIEQQHNQASRVALEST